MRSSHPRPLGRKRPASGDDRSSLRPRLLCVTLSYLLVASALAACGQQPPSAKTPTPTSTPVVGVHQITPPWHVTYEKNSFDRYVVSRDVAGLIVACHVEPTKSTNPTNPDPSGTAHLWRSRDGGAHWQALAPTLSASSCSTMMMVAGSNGLLMAGGVIQPGSGTGTILISPDAGDTWKTESHFLPNEIAANHLDAMRQAVYRDGKVYASLSLNAAIELRFSVSADDGLTWTPVDQIPPRAPGQMAVMTYQFAPDYRAPHAWFRLAIHGPLNFNLPHYTTLDRSTDDGHTWKTVTQLHPGAAELPYGSNVQALVTTKLQPSRLCLGLVVPIESGSLNGYSDLTLATSDDSGATWRYTVMSNANFDGRTGEPEPIIDAFGSCYLTLSPSGAIGTETFPSYDSVILRLAPGAQAQTELVAKFPSQFAGLLAVFMTSLATQRSLSVSSVPIPTHYDSNFHATFPTGKQPDYNVPNLLIDTALV